MWIWICGVQWGKKIHSYRTVALHLPVFNHLWLCSMVSLCMFDDTDCPRLKLRKDELVKLFLIMCACNYADMWFNVFVSNNCLILFDSIPGMRTQQPVITKWGRGVKYCIVVNLFNCMNVYQYNVNMQEEVYNACVSFFAMHV